MMADSPSESGLHEYIDLQVTLTEPVTPGQEQALRDSLRKLKGVQETRVARDKVSVNYEPVFVSERELLSAIEQAGVKTQRATVGASSPLTDAFEQTLQPPGTTSVPQPNESDGPRAEEA